MVGKLFQEFFLFLMNGERGCRLELFICEYMERNCSAQNFSKICKQEAYPYLQNRSKVPCKRSHNSSGVHSLVKKHLLEEQILRKEGGVLGKTRKRACRIALHAAIHSCSGALYVSLYFFFCMSFT